MLGKSRAVQTMQRRQGRRQRPAACCSTATRPSRARGSSPNASASPACPATAPAATIHFVINNQVGFTTCPQFARCSPYPSDVAKARPGADPPRQRRRSRSGDLRLQAGDRIPPGLQPRHRHRHVVLPPLRPQRRRRAELHPAADVRGDPASIRRSARSMAQRLIAEGVVDQAWIDRKTARIHRLPRNRVRGGHQLPAQQGRLVRRAAGRASACPGEPVDARRNVNTAIDRRAVSTAWPQLLTTVPADLTIHKTLARILEAKKKTLESGEGIDWATAEALAFGSLREDGYRVRLSGQDSGRGTFSQRHAVWVDQTTGEKYIPLRPSSATAGPCSRSATARCREFGVLGFEYGYSHRRSADAGAVGSAVRRLRQRRADDHRPVHRRGRSQVAARHRAWSCCCRTASRGRGRSIRSARLERYLQLCAEDNIQVANCTTPANYFHILRRQMLRDFRKPLIMMTPKSLLRHKLAVSQARRFHRRRPFPPHPERPRIRPLRARPGGLVLCSGKLAYELMEARDAAGDRRPRSSASSSSIPSRASRWSSASTAMPKLEELVWAQEEPKNNGAWHFVEDELEECLTEAGHKGKRARYAGRAVSASPATGLAKRHAAEQAALIADALGHSSRSAQTAQASVREPRPMATDVKVPTLGESITEGDARPVAEEARRSGRRGRADRQPRDRQGLGRGAVAGRRHAGASSCSRKAIRSRSARSSPGSVKRGAAVAAPWPRLLATPVNPPGAGEAPALRKEPEVEHAEHADLTLSPAVRRAVLEHHVDPSKIHGTGKDGRLTKDDVLAAAKAKESAPARPGSRAGGEGRACAVRRSSAGSAGPRPARLRASATKSGSR